MRTSRLLFLLPVLALAVSQATAQTNTPASATPDTNAAPAFNSAHIHPVDQPGQSTLPPATYEAGPALDPNKIAEYQKRFAQGYALEKTGQPLKALAIYNGILAEQPNAKRSLLEAGNISYQLGDLAKADEYFSRLHAIVPDFPYATELLIQVNQALKHDVKAELLIQEFKKLHDSGDNPDFTGSPLFVREIIPSGKDQITVSQFFDYHKDPNTVWMAELFAADGTLKRRILLNYDSATTDKLRASDPTKYANMEVFVWLEHVIKDQRVKELDVYLQIFQLPDYNKFRSAMLLILANPPKPILSQPVDVPLDSSPQPTSTSPPQ